ncbi:amino acid adenylation domain-containing protein [Streptomyces sp. NPDC006450]|uniref:non-ribosomal peptide synthetase n=1 Tax=Streptomyces sp. NPDC006450 TaxID=3155458 RepID=UPI0033BEC5DF
MSEQTLYEEDLSDDETFELPTSFGQDRLWLLDRLGAGSAYHVGGAIRLDGPLDADALERAVACLVERHEILRTTFEFGLDGQLVQLVHPHAEVPTPRLDPPEPTQAAARRTLESYLDTPFDLATGPLLRTALVRFDEEAWLFGVAMHHIVSDGWSIGLFHAELAAFYRAETGGPAADLPELAIQYGDFAAWQREAVETAGPEFTTYWREHMEGAVALEPPVPATGAAGAPADARLTVPAAVVEAVGKLARQQSATPFMVLLAAYKAVLARWTERDDIVVGTPVAGRGRPELENLMGFFVNTLPLRTSVDPAASFRSLLGAVRETCLGAFEHQDLPFERIVELSGADRVSGRTPLVAAAIALQNTPSPRWDVPGLTAQAIEHEDLQTQFSLSLNLAEAADGGLTGRLAHDAQWDAEDVRLLADAWLALLTDALADPMKPVGRLALGARTDTAEEATPPAGEGLVHQWIADVAREYGDRVAISEAGNELTYRELDERSDRWARLLRAHGVGPDRIVALCMRRSTAQLVAALGVLKAGAAYLPLDPAHPRARLAALVADAAPPVVLTDESTFALFEGETTAGTEVLRADTAPDAGLGTAPDARSGTAPESAPELVPGSVREGPPYAWEDQHPDSLAYVMYTSGSTGTPKGAMNTHRGLANELRWARERFGHAQYETVLHKAPWTFDVAVWEWLGALSAGARVVLAKPDGHHDPRYLAELVVEESVTACDFVPSMLQAFLAEPAAARCAGVLRLVQCGGEALTAATVRRFREVLPGTALVNLYGPAEAAVEVSHHEVEERDADRSRVPIGRQLPGVRLHVLDRRGEPVLPGAPGELYIGGVAVGRGYLGAPALTADRFVPDPFAADGSRLYRTGDRVRRRPDGALEFLGRYDHQVKLRGQRVELGEIEAVIGRHPDVGQATVLVQGAGADSHAVAYLGCPERLPASDELRGFLLGVLPAAWVPSAFVVLPALPVTRNGKLDRAALLTLGPGTEGRAASVPPRTPAERLLAGIWAEVLQRTDVGVRDNFYEVGGNSLRAVRVFQRAQEEGLLVSLNSMLGDHTVEELAAGLGDRSGEALHDMGRLL